MNNSVNKKSKWQQFEGDIRLATYPQISELEIFIHSDSETIGRLDNFFISHSIIAFRDVSKLEIPILATRDSEIEKKFFGSIRPAKCSDESEFEIRFNSTSADAITALDAFFRSKGVIGNKAQKVLIIPLNS